MNSKAVDHACKPSFCPSVEHATPSTDLLLNQSNHVTLLVLLLVQSLDWYQSRFELTLADSELAVPIILHRTVQISTMRTFGILDDHFHVPHSLPSFMQCCVAIELVKRGSV